MLHGVLIVHPDVVDMNMNVWGDGWPSELGTLFASVRLPEGTTPTKVWGNPPFIEPTIVTHGNVVSMTARDIPEHQLVALRVLFPSDAITGSDVQSDPRPALAGITAAEEQAAGAYHDEKSRLDTARRWWPVTALILLALATIPVGIVILVLYLRRGREYDTGYHEQYEREPPSDDPPALVTSLVAQREHVGSREFTATLFDLIVRKQVRTLAGGQRLAGDRLGRRRRQPERVRAEGGGHGRHAPEGERRPGRPGQDGTRRPRGRPHDAQPDRAEVQRVRDGRPPRGALARLGRRVGVRAADRAGGAAGLGRGRLS